MTVFEQDVALDGRPRDWNFGIYWVRMLFEEVTLAILAMTLMLRFPTCRLRIRLYVLKRYHLWEIHDELTSVLGGMSA